jgi:Family of unknown function (DUF5317)
MRFTIVTVISGLVLGVAAGGRLRFVADHPIRAGGLLITGLALQGLPIVVDLGSFTIAALLASYFLLLCFTAANIRLVGMAIVTAGLAANIVVIALNGGMPVRAQAVTAAHIASASEVPGLAYGHKRHLERRSDRLIVLADIIPVPQLHEVLSFGDLVLSVGIADVLFHLLRPRKLSSADADLLAT